MQILKVMPRAVLGSGIVALLLASGLPIAAQESLTWSEAKTKFEAANPALRADALGVDEMRAAETTAFLRPNPGIGLSSDGLQIAPHTTPGLGTHWMPLTGTQLVPSINYLHERERKRELRLQSAKEGTQIAGSQHEDLERNLLFDLRSQFVTLPAPISITTTRSSPSAAAASKLAIWRKLIWTASNCCECNTKSRCRRPSSTCAPPRFNFCNCSTTARRLRSLT
jgi:hypothetical protein